MVGNLVVMKDKIKVPLMKEFKLVISIRMISFLLIVVLSLMMEVM